MTKLVIAFTTWSVVAFGQYEIYLKEPNQIPLYAQQTNVWCGAASAQMMLEGFPQGVKHKFEQKMIWDTIQTMKVEQSWYTDPDGLKNVMDELGGDSHWVTTCSKTANPLMRFIVRNLSDRKYPTSVLVYGDAHWIVIIGATLDTDPNLAETVKLEKIEAHDPWKAQHVLVTGSAWYQKYWNSPARSRGKWNGCYVAVYENTQTARDDQNIFVASTSKTIFTPLTHEQLFEQADHHLKVLAEAHPSFSVLAPLAKSTPRLVAHESGSYYLITLGDGRTANGAIMLDLNGEFEGVAKFEKPLNQVQIKNIEGEWLFTPSEESRSPFLPVFAVRSEAETSYIDFEGNYSKELHPLVAGS